jgi:hypothetical protein
MAYKIKSKIKKAEYSLEPFYKQRAKYYLFGTLAGAGLVTDALLLSRNPYEYISGLVLVGSSALGYVADYKHQIGKGFVGRKIYTFKDGMKILADDKNNALITYKKQLEHKKNPHKFVLFHFGERK